LVTASAKFRLAKEIYIIIIINKLFKLCKIKFSVKYAMIVKCHPRPLLPPQTLAATTYTQLPGARFWRRILAETSRSNHARDLGQDLGREKARQCLTRVAFDKDLLSFST
jgi:hypothetical protein